MAQEVADLTRREAAILQGDGQGAMQDMGVEPACGWIQPGPGEAELENETDERRSDIMTAS